MCEELFVYLFGYGSLMWRPGFKYSRKFNGYIKNWKRVFYQGSTDHRGTVDAPGRVVTLIKQDENKTINNSDTVATNNTEEEWITWGTIYCVPDDEATSILKNLDYREKGGYERHELDVFVEDKPDSVAKAIVYVATTDNVEYLGEDTVQNIALQIFKSVGPSGRNIDYLLKLANALHEINVMDHHVFSIEREVLILMQQYQINEGFIHNASVSSPISILSSSPSRQQFSSDNSPSSGSSSPNGGVALIADASLDNVLQHRKFYQKTKGIIVIDDGAVEAISQRAKSLLPVGIVNIVGDFKENELVSICDTNSQEISRGIINYNSNDLKQIIGKNSKEIPNILTSNKNISETVIDNSNLILL